MAVLLSPVFILVLFIQLLEVYYNWAKVWSTLYFEEEKTIYGYLMITCSVLATGFMFYFAWLGYCQTCSWAYSLVTVL